MTSTAYIMRAFKTSVPTGHVYWSSIGSPDLTGALSGFNPSELTGITIDYTATTPLSASGTPPTGLASGDLSGNFPGPSVVGIRTHPVPAPTGTNTVLTWSGSTFSWGVGGGGGGFTAGGDLTGTSSSQTVIAINGASVPVSGSLTTGNVLQVSGSSALSYAPLNLAGGANFITGVLPAGNQAAQTLGGDLSGTTSSATVVALQGNAFASGAPTKGQFVVATSTSAYGPVTLSGDISESATTAGLLTVVSISGSSPIAITPANLQWITGASSPLLSQADNTSASATAKTLTIQSQNATGTTSNGGALAFKAGTGTTAGGVITFNTASTTTLAEAARVLKTTQWQFGPNSRQATTGMINLQNQQDLPSGATNCIAIRNAANSADGLTINVSNAGSSRIEGTGVMLLKGTGMDLFGDSWVLGDSSFNTRFSWLNMGTTASTLQGAAATTAFTINFANTAVNSATGASLTLTAQNATGTTTTGGALTISSGTGTSINGAVNLQVGGTTTASLATNKFILNKGMRRNSTNVSSTTYVVLVSDDVIFANSSASGANAAIAITLPSSPTVGDIYTIKDSGGFSATNSITISPASGTIDGAASFIINTNYASYMFVRNSSEWSIL